jgi:hypothetical protein
VFSSLARAESTVISFDDLTTGGPGGAGALVTVNSQYAAEGVTFNELSAIDYSKGPLALPGFAHSGTVAVEPCFGAEFCTQPVAATFTAAQRMVRVWVGFSSPLTQPVQVQLQALGAGSALVGTASATLPVSSTVTPIRTPLAVELGSPQIMQLRVSIPGGYDNALAVDDVEFSNVGPPPPCTASGVPSIRLDQPPNGTIVQSDLFSLQGSVDGRGAPIESASVRATATGRSASLFPAPIGPGGGSFSVAQLSGLLAAGAQNVVVSAANCRGTGTAEASVFWCRNNAPLSGSATVSTYAELKTALTTCRKDVFVANNAQIDLAAISDNRTGALDYVLRVPDGVTLESGRSPTGQGALLYMSRRLPNQPHMLDLGSNTQVTGLRLRGYDPFNADDPKAISTDGIFVGAVQDVLIDNNEIWGWANAGVEISNALNTEATANRIRIERNYIHNNVSCAGDGYGIVVGGSGFAEIDLNVFDYDRHDVADDGQPSTGYIAQFNFVLTSGPKCDGNYNQHFDMHGIGGGHYGGTAGQFVLIRNNTIRGAQTYGGFLGINAKTRPAFELRGTPVERAIFEDNAVAAGDEDGAVRIGGADRDTLKRRGKLVVRRNQYGVDTSRELAVGDFNGDGRSDVFQAAGAVWAYAPSGNREWQVLNDSSLRLNRLGFADFNGDGKTDVFSQQGDKWRVSYGGTTDWQLLPAGSNIDMRTYRFADFDGDRKADVFRANGSHWYISSGGATAWRQLNTSRLKIGDLRFGDFDGDGKTDVFSLANGQWSVSYGGASPWRRLNRRISDDLGPLVFADFNGDGKTDVARGGEGKWQVSSDGVTPWRTLNSGNLPPLGLTLVGDFGGDRRADALQCVTVAGSPPVLVGLERYKLSSGGASKLVPWSLANMR